MRDLENERMIVSFYKERNSIRTLGNLRDLDVGFAYGLPLVHDGECRSFLGDQAEHIYCTFRHQLRSSLNAHSA